MITVRLPTGERIDCHIVYADIPWGHPGPDWELDDAMFHGTDVSVPLDWCLPDGTTVEVNLLELILKALAEGPSDDDGNYYVEAN